MTNPLTLLRDWRASRRLVKARANAPRSIKEAVDRIIQDMSEEARRAFTLLDLDEAICGPGHFSGMGLRNSWSLWGHDTPLCRELAALGLHHGDDRSGYLYSAAWHRLNYQPFDSEAEVARYRKHWAALGRRMDGSSI